jgi:hypothetical protein
MVAALAAVVGAALLAGPAAAKTDFSQAVGISSISPAVADRGGTVSITGNGFGGRNVRITVGGDPVELVSATGSRASFRVPALGAVGKVVVEARNPGGHVGRIGLTVRFDGNTVAVADEAAAVATAVGAEGGTIAVEGMSLAIPAGAVADGTEITATPLRSLRGSPFAATPVGLKLEPSGLVLLQPATLTLPRPSGSGQLVGVGFERSGEEFHLVPHTLVGDSVQLQVWHFSGAAVLQARLDELEAVLGYETTRAHGKAEQRIAAALAQGLAPAETEVLIRSALLDWYQHAGVRHGLEHARTGPVGNFELAFGEWQAWLAYLSLYSTSSWSLEITEASGLALQAAGAQAGRILDLCTGASGVPFTPFRNLARLATAVELASLPLEQMLAPDGRQLPSGTNLTGACVHVDLLSVTHAAALARNRDNRFTIATKVVFWNGSPRSDLAMRFELADATDGPLVPLTNATTSTGSWQTTIRPTTLGERRLDLTAELSTSSGVDLSSTAASRRFTVLVRERLELQARRAADLGFSDTIGTVASGSNVTLRIRLAGDNVAAIPIALTHDGSGTLPASATTDATGEARVTYTAPANAATQLIELVTATVTENGVTTGDAISITTRPTITVSVDPSFGFASPGGSVRFTATVMGTTDQRVTWSVSGGGTISDSGLFTASSSAPDGATFDVIARSSADPTSFGGATVQIVGEDVTGRYVGVTCSINDVGDESCSPPNRTLAYACFFQSNVRPGTTCGWTVDAGFGVPHTIPFCFIESDGTTAGGAFRATVTSCAFRPASTFADTRIEGTIGRGRLEIQVYAPSGAEGEIGLVERISMTRVSGL